MTSTPLSPEGRLTIDLVREGGRLSARMASSRPAGIGRAFTGREPREVLAIVPHIFTLCGVAHTVAAVDAYEEAQGISTPPVTHAARRAAVAFETAREHCLRIAIDWPRFLGEEPDRTHLPQIMGLLPMARKALAAGGDPFQPGAVAAIDGSALEAAVAALGRVLHAAVFGETPEAWLALRDADALAEWSARRETIAARFLRLVIERGWQELGAAEARFLPHTGRETMAAAFEGAQDFSTAPVWEGSPRETSPLVRQARTPLIAALMAAHGTGLLPRAAARLAELAAIYEGMRAATQAPAPADPERVPDGTGLAQIEAARGRLMHYLRLDGGRVARYAITAPVDWNFHPQGTAVKALESLAFLDTRELRGASDMVMNAIDPCVAYDLRMH